MRKSFLSLILVVLMLMSVLAACNNEDQPIDKVESSNQDIQEGTTDLDNSVDSSGNQEAINVIELNMMIPPKDEPSQSEMPEKVLKLTAVGDGEADSKQIIVNLEEFTIPAGATLEYDVYLETTAVGMGIFDMRVGNQYISAFAVDSAGIENFITEDLSNMAYKRWYHRVFELNTTEEQTSKMVRFAVGGVTNGNTNVAYYDNICVKDADGNVVYMLDENFIANYEIKQSNGLTCTFEVVDDPAPTVARKTADDFRYIHEYMGKISGSDKIEVSFVAENKQSAPAIYVGEIDDSCVYGVRGFILGVDSGSLTLYRSEETVSVLASQQILGMDKDFDCSIRLEVDGTAVRGYWLDDMDGVEPWPEFELSVEGLEGKNYGIMELYGHGITVKTVSHGECPHKDISNSYVNPVISDSADPDILYYDGLYYLYNTSAGYNVYTSSDLVNWELKGNCIDPGFTWADTPLGFHWAPDVEYYNGKFYMVCSVDYHIGIAVADSPLGPFIPEKNYLFKDSIDGNLFIDDDGQAYLYFVRGEIYGVKINMETLEVDESSITMVIKNTDKWETYNKENVPYESEVCEGPYMLKHNGLYYLTYSGSDYLSVNYAVGYGVSESPLGPFIKYEGNPIHIGNSAISGTAHHCFIQSPEGELFIFYHNHLTTTVVHPRSACVDRARFVPTALGIDRLETYGPTTLPQPMPLERE